MALSIKNAEAERLARVLAKLTGETLTETIMTSLRQRLARERAKHDTPARIAAFSRRIRASYDTRPVTEAEWDAASGDEEMIGDDFAAKDIKSALALQ